MDRRDFPMGLPWIRRLQNGLPLDMDVYDLATWCSNCELSERAVRERKILGVPDFMRVRLSDDACGIIRA